MIEKVLVANRGEIALRIIRACKELGIRSVAVYSDADVNGLHVRYADESYRIGPPDPSDSYLNIDRIVEVALECGADAIHPGYGFLSENPEFARRCEEEGIIFVGPSSRTLELSGDKLACKKEMERHGIPTIPGSEVAGEEDAIKVAKELGYPILLKSVYGGGGRGIRLVRDEEELQKALKVAMMEAKAAFGREELYIEKYIEGARHIEFQILRDAYGHAVHLGERESSIQRRYQKLIELSPSPMLDEGMREEMGRMAVKAAEAIEYMNAGTIEFLVDR
ncbi:MAG: ATP-grasp domain-containing protein, partial [Thaumarchaeota archaeon]|nr:ATP-grasp domain-containing protein [Nitrososphaerota archaeon]